MSTCAVSPLPIPASLSLHSELRHVASIGLSWTVVTGLELAAAGAASHEKVAVGVGIGLRQCRLADKAGQRLGRVARSVPVVCSRGGGMG